MILCTFFYDQIYVDTLCLKVGKIDLRYATEMRLQSFFAQAGADFHCIAPGTVSCAGLIGCASDSGIYLCSILSDYT